jgi:hypothetical protein
MATLRDQAKAFGYSPAVSINWERVATERIEHYAPGDLLPDTRKIS